MKCVVFLSLLGLCCFHQASGVVHSHHYMYTATTGMSGFPEFVIVGAVDGQQINYYDSNIKEMIPRHEWVRGAVDADFWKRNGQNALGTQSTFAVNLVTLKERFNQTGGVHAIQLMYGCEWDDETGNKGSKYQYAYDGEDFISADMQNMKWVAPVQQALATKHKWDADRGHLSSWKEYANNECIDWLKKYLSYGSSTLKRKVSPEVSVFKKDSSLSRVVCQATGFYPQGMMITWRKDGVEMEEDVYVGETLPNEDGTFQKRAVLTVSPEERKNGQYTCEVAHQSGPPIVKGIPEEDGNTRWIIIGCVVAAMILIGVIVAVVMMKKKDYKRAGQSDTDSDNSDPSKVIRT